MADPIIEFAKERSWLAVAEIDAAHARGELDDAGWHRAMAALIVPAYLRAKTEQGGSGHSGTSDEWEWSRGVVAEALDRDGAFLDVGCANGLLMESVVRWARDRGLAIEPYGLDIARELVEIARTRLPRWADRIFEGNALGWSPGRRFEYVRTGLEYVPTPRRAELVAWLLAHVVAPGGRLIIGKYNEETADRGLERSLTDFVITGRAERAHSDPRIRYRVLWIDAAPGSAGSSVRAHPR